MIESVLAGLVGAVAVLVVVEPVKHALERRRRRVEVAQDAIVDVLTTLHAVQDLLEREFKTPLSCPDDVGALRKLPSAYYLRPPYLDRQRLLDNLDTPTIYRLIMLFCDRYDAFVAWRDNYSDMYRWLLDTNDWKPAGAQERVDQLKSSSREMKELLREMRLYGWALVGELYTIAQQQTLTRYDAEHISVFIARHYSVAAKTLETLNESMSEEDLPTVRVPSALRAHNG